MLFLTSLGYVTFVLDPATHARTHTRTKHLLNLADSRNIHTLRRKVWYMKLPEPPMIILAGSPTPLNCTVYNLPIFLHVQWTNWKDAIPIDFFFRSCVIMPYPLTHSLIHSLVIIRGWMVEAKRIIHHLVLSNNMLLILNGGACWFGWLITTCITEILRLYLTRGLPSFQVSIKGCDCKDAAREYLCSHAHRWRILAFGTVPFSFRWRTITESISCWCLVGVFLKLLWK